LLTICCQAPAPAPSLERELLAYELEMAHWDDSFDHLPGGWPISPGLLS